MARAGRRRSQNRRHVRSAASVCDRDRMFLMGCGASTIALACLCSCDYSFWHGAMASLGSVRRHASLAESRVTPRACLAAGAPLPPSLSAAAAAAALKPAAAAAAAAAAQRQRQRRQRQRRLWQRQRQQGVGSLRGRPRERLLEPCLSCRVLVRGRVVGSDAVSERVRAGTVWCGRVRPAKTECST